MDRDLVYRLRNVSKGQIPYSLLEEAAQEIERLDERVDDLRTALYVEQREDTRELFHFSFLLFFLVLIVIIFIQLVA